MQPQHKQLLMKAQQGRRAAREQLLRKYRSFARRVACGWAKRPLTWGRDDELSVALIALDEAIDRYDSDRGASFRTFAAQVIRSRLTDNMRSQAGSREVEILDDPAGRSAAARKAAEKFAAGQKARERSREMAEFESEMSRLGIDLQRLQDASPTHQSRRERLKGVARSLAADSDLMDRLLRTCRLPQSDLVRMTGVSKKVLERGRPYIIALAVIMTGQQYENLRAFLGLPFLGKDEEY